MRTAIYPSLPGPSFTPSLVGDLCASVQLEYSIDIHKSPERVFNLLVAVESWPAIFDQCRRGQVMGLHGDKELVEITTVAGNRVHQWRSIRAVTPAEGKIEFQQLTVYSPILALSGYWQVAAAIEVGCCVTLVHHITVLRDAHILTDGDADAWARDATEAKTRAHLEALKHASERNLRVA